MPVMWPRRWFLPRVTGMMLPRTAILDAGRNAKAFWFGSALVTAGVALHVPMFAMGRPAGYVLAGMAMGQGMYWGMAFIVMGIGCATGAVTPDARGPFGRRWSRLTMRRCGRRIGAWPRCWRSRSSSTS